MSDHAANPPMLEREWAEGPLITDSNVIRKSKEVYSDQVNAPNHYTQGAIECVDAIKASMTREAFHGFLKGNAMKYMWRYQDKENPAQDLDKGEWYMQRLIKEMSFE